MNTDPTAEAVSVGASPVILIEDATSPAAKEDGRCTYIVFNNSGADAIYLGDADVTLASGLPVPPQAATVIDIRLGGKLWAVAAATTDVRVMRVP